MEDLVLELKNEIIEALNLEDVKPEDINDDDPLFGSGLGLDSIDALELIVLLERKYGIKLKDPNKGKALRSEDGRSHAPVPEDKASRPV